MSGECRDCGEHCVDFTCVSHGIPCGDYYPEHAKMSAVRLRDELFNLRGLLVGVLLLIKDDEYKEYKHNPIECAMIIIEEKLSLIDKGLKRI